MTVEKHTVKKEVLQGLRFNAFNMIDKTTSSIQTRARQKGKVLQTHT